MLKRDITYEDLNGQKQTETFYFNLTKREMVEMEVEHKEGIGAWFQKVLAAKDRKAIVQQFQELILLTYGEKSDDGKRFIKNDELRTEFSQSCAYEVLFEELASDDKKAASFFLGVLPNEIAAEAKKELEKELAAASQKVE